MSEYTTTPHLNLFKPNYDQDDGTWGTHLNANADTIDATFGAGFSYAQLPPEVALVPITFSFAGKPASGALANAPMAMVLVIPPSLAGTVVYDTTRTSLDAGFVVNRIIGGNTITPIGTITITSFSNTSANLTGPGATLAAGDVLQIVAPTQDATLADLGITLMAKRI